MKVKTSVKAGGITVNRSESIKVKTGVRAGGLTVNRAETARKA